MTVRLHHDKLQIRVTVVAPRTPGLRLHADQGSRLHRDDGAVNQKLSMSLQEEIELFMLPMLVHERRSRARRNPIQGHLHAGKPHRLTDEQLGVQLGQRAGLPHRVVGAASHIAYTRHRVPSSALTSITI